MNYVKVVLGDSTVKKVIIACTTCGLAALGLKAIQQTTLRVTTSQEFIDQQSCRLEVLSIIKQTWEWIAADCGRTTQRHTMGMRNFPAK